MGQMKEVAASYVVCIYLAALWQCMSFQTNSLDCLPFLNAHPDFYGLAICCGPATWVFHAPAGFYKLPTIYSTSKRLLSGTQSTSNVPRGQREKRHDRHRLTYDIMASTVKETARSLSTWSQLHDFLDTEAELSIIHGEGSHLQLCFEAKSRDSLCQARSFNRGTMRQSEQKTQLSLDAC